MTDLYVDTLGDRHAPTSLLFLHGGMGLDHTYFRPFVDPLADVAQLVFMDHRLNGRSPRTSVPPATLQTMVDDAAAVAAAHCRGAVIPVGHSFGAYIALGMAARSPSNVAGVVLVGSGHSSTIGNTLAAYATRAGTVEQQAFIARGFAGQLTTDDDYEAAWRSIIPMYCQRPDAALMERVIGRISFSARGFNSFLTNAFGQLDYTVELPRLQVPVLFIAGADDWVEHDPSGGSAAAAQLATRGRCVTIEQSGHFPFAEQPDAFCAAIREWLRAEANKSR